MVLPSFSQLLTITGLNRRNGFNWRTICEDRETMAIVIDLADRRSLSMRSRPTTGGSAQILLFTGVRFERLELNDHRDGDLLPPPDDQTLRNRTG
jgi:hypothetical protein